MRRKALLSLLTVGIVGAVLVGWAFLVDGINLSSDATFFAAFFGGILIGYPAGPALVMIWSD